VTLNTLGVPCTSKSTARSCKNIVFLGGSRTIRMIFSNPESDFSLFRLTLIPAHVDPLILTDQNSVAVCPFTKSTESSDWLIVMVAASPEMGTF